MARRVKSAQVVVDASGQGTMISSRLGLREWDKELRKAALWTYWNGAYRDAGRDEGATIVLQTQGKKGWFWYIPLHNNVISVGVVSNFDYLFKNRDGKSHEEIYLEEVEALSGGEAADRDGRAVTDSMCKRSIRIRRSSRPATDGSSSATRSDFSIRFIPRACCWPSNRVN